MNGMGKWTMGMVAIAASTAAQAEGQLGPVFGTVLLHEEPQSAVLAMVGVGLLVLTVFAKRRRDP
jgi:hypothetical protein